MFKYTYTLFEETKNYSNVWRKISEAVTWKRDSQLANYMRECLDNHAEENPETRYQLIEVVARDDTSQEIYKEDLK